MRDRPFNSANEAPRPFGDVLAERRLMDPKQRAIDATLAEVAQLEGEAADTVDAAERKRLQCEAEALRAAIHESTKGRRI